ncbi:MAG: hypothetical protein Q9M41_06825 [Paracoccaceae bacterium]|nr:hypothetical protein [Paracoccaceae bacterium]
MARSETTAQIAGALGISPKTADKVWSMLRNFNDMSWAEAIMESVESLNGKGATR